MGGFSAQRSAQPQLCRGDRRAWGTQQSQEPDGVGCSRENRGAGAPGGTSVVFGRGPLGGFVPSIPMLHSGHEVVGKGLSCGTSTGRLGWGHSGRRAAGLTLTSDSPFHLVLCPCSSVEGGGPALCEKMSYGSISGSGGLGSRGPFGGPSRQGYQPLGNDGGGRCGQGR